MTSSFSPQFLSTDDVLIIHEEQIRLYGGEGGILNIGLLISAVSQPKVTFSGNFLHTDVYEMAGAYFYHIVANHAFIDGNKRTGLVSTLQFLSQNDFSIEYEADILTATALGIAEGTFSKEATTSVLRSPLG